MSDLSDLGFRVRTSRQDKQWNVRDLAKHAGVSVSYVYAVEAGQRGRNIVKLEQIARALGVPLSRLCEGKRDW